MEEEREIRRVEGEILSILSVPVVIKNDEDKDRGGGDSKLTRSKLLGFGRLFP